jgi:hypothetical protein
VVPGEIVVHDMTDFMQRRRLEKNFRLLLQEVCRHVDDERLVPHLLVAHDVREYIADVCRVVPCLDGIIHQPKADLVAGA